MSKSYSGIIIIKFLLERRRYHPIGYISQRRDLKWGEEHRIRNREPKMCRS